LVGQHKSNRTPFLIREKATAKTSWPWPRIRVDKNSVDMAVVVIDRMTTVVKIVGFDQPSHSGVLGYLLPVILRRMSMANSLTQLMPLP
jgi:hypothetical protein